MNYKRILFSVGTIAVVGALAVGATGAFFTSTATSEGNTFNSGSLNLLLNLDENSDGWLNSHTNTPGYNDLSPGGDEANLSARLQNDGTADAAGIGLSVNHTTNENNIAKQMRVTQLDWKGESLLEGGAGANLSDYTAPSDCDVTVSSGDSIQTEGIDDAASGETVCVEAGTYIESVTIDAPLTLTSVDGAALTTISTNDKVGVMIESSDVTVRGFSVTVNNMNGSDTYGEYGIRLEPSDAVQNILIEKNIVENIEDNFRPSGISLDMKNTADETATNVTVRHNIVRNITSEASPDEAVAKAINPNERFDNLVIENNTIQNIGGSDSAGAIGIDFSSDTGVSPHAGPENFTIARNDIDGITIGDEAPTEAWKDDLALYFHKYGNLGNHSVTENNFRGVSVHYNTEGVSNPDTLDATNNWWGQVTGPASGQVQVQGDVNTSDILGGPHIGFINGTDNNGNGFADLHDLAHNPVANATPGLDAGEKGQLDFYVQLDGPTTGNNFQNQNLTSDFTFTLGQVAQ